MSDSTRELVSTMLGLFLAYGGASLAAYATGATARDAAVMGIAGMCVWAGVYAMASALIERWWHYAHENARGNHG